MIMKKLLFIIVAIVSLNSCTTYTPVFPEPSERVNPYAQKPVPNDGAASFIKDIITK